MTDTTTPADTPLTLDQLLADAAARPATITLGADDAAPWGSAERVRGLREAAATAELTLDGLLEAVDALFGAGCTVRIRAELADLEGCVHHLADIATEARATVDDLRAARERARSVVVLLEGALAAADERERRARGVLADLLSDGYAGDTTDESRAADCYRHAADRLALALDFDADADPGATGPTPLPATDSEVPTDV